MERVSAEVHRAVDDIGQIVRRDGGELEVQEFDPGTGVLVVVFRKSRNDECTDCTIDEAMVRAFLAEAVKAQGVELTSLQIQSPE
jgi:hypothetical protein